MLAVLYLAVGVMSLMTALHLLHHEERLALRDLTPWGRVGFVLRTLLGWPLILWEGRSARS